MGDSNGDWGQLAVHDSDAAEAWDGYERLPEQGDNPVLDAFCESKRITIASLVRIGARLAEPDVLAFVYPGGLKYRDINTGKRWSWYASDFHSLKIIRASGADLSSEQIIVCEGETDAARLTELYTCDVAALPAGALAWSERYAEQLREYDMILVGLDNDEVGERGARQIIERFPNAMRFAPPANDWCDSEEVPPLPTEVEREGITDLIVFGGELLDLEIPDVTSWFEHALLPVGGQLILHGWKAAFKSWLALDLMSALAQGKDWATFEPMEEACRTCVIQFEIPWAFYQARCRQLRDQAADAALWDSNFGTWTPLVRPTLAAGNTKHEDAILGPLVEQGIQVVLIDPIRRATGSIDMNAEQDARKILGFFERLQREGITVVAVHHDRKSNAGQAEADITSMTGSGAFAGDADSLVSVTLPRGVEMREPRRNLSFTIRNGPGAGNKGFEINEAGQLMYSPEPFYDGEDDDDAPSI